MCGSGKWMKTMNAGRTILIADDQAVNREILGRILSDSYSLLYAEDGVQTLEILRRETEQICVVLLDIVMPRMDGYDVLKAMREDERLSQIPVLVTTQREGDAEELRALSLGAYDFLTKPYKPEIIRHRVARTIRLLESAALLSRAELQARMDSLTGLLNRAAFEQTVSRYLQSNAAQQGALLMLDLDNFKTVNDLRGHVAGDQLLEKIGAQLRSCFRGEDIVARLGGDEFAAFLPCALTPEQLMQRMEHICARFAVFDETYHVTCSVGACRAPEDGQDYQTLYHCADVALITAKRLGKNRFRLYSGGEMPLPSQFRSMDWLLDEVSEGIVITDRATREILYLNRAACAIAGREKRECIGENCYRALWGRVAPCPFCASEQEVGERVHTCGMTNPDDRKIYTIKTQLFLWDSRPARIEYIQEVTDKTRFLNRFYLALESLKVGVVKFRMDEALTLLEANDAFFALLECTRDAFANTYENSVARIVAPEMLEENRRRFADARHEPVSMRSVLRTDTGRSLCVLSTAVVIDGADGDCCYCVFSDWERQKEVMES